MGIDPSKLRAVQRDRITRLDPTTKKMQLHGLLRIIMPYDPEGNRHIDTDIQLLPQLPMQTFLQRFARLPLPSRKLPQPAEMHPCLAARDEIPPFPHDQTRRNLDELHLNHSTIGKSNHCTIGSVHHRLSDQCCNGP